ALVVSMDCHHAQALDLAVLSQLWCSRDCHGMLPELQYDVAQFLGTREPGLVERDCARLRAEQLPSLIFNRKGSLWVVDESSRRVARARCIDSSETTSIEPIRNGYRVCYDYDDVNDRLYAFDCEYHRIFVYKLDNPEFCQEIDVGSYDEYAMSSKCRCLDGLVFLAYVNTERTTALRCIDLRDTAKPTEARLLWTYGGRFYGSRLRDFIVSRVPGQRGHYTFAYVYADEVIRVALELNGPPTHSAPYREVVSSIPRGRNYIRDIRVITPNTVLVIDSSHPEGSCSLHIFQFRADVWHSCHELIAFPVRGLYEVAARPDGLIYMVYSIRGRSGEILLKTYECVWS
ncbi:hypothetical protein Pmar_PMAR002226, partial [Perkinsus marinus ATCC 50983]